MSFVKSVFGFLLMCHMEEGNKWVWFGLTINGKEKGKGNGMVHTLKWIFFGVNFHGVIATCEGS